MKLAWAAVACSIAGCTRLSLSRDDFDCGFGGPCLLAVEIGGDPSQTPYGGHAVRFEHGGTTQECRGVSGPERARCVYSFELGTRLELTAQSTRGTARDWLGDCDSVSVFPDRAICTVEMTRSREVFADFVVSGAIGDAGVRQYVDGPVVVLVLDASGSTGFDDAATSVSCPVWHATHMGEQPVPTSMTANQVMRAALTGCTGRDEGFFDRWSHRANFGMVAFGFDEAPHAFVNGTFGAPRSALEASVEALRPRQPSADPAGMVVAGEYLAQSYPSDLGVARKLAFILLVDSPAGIGQTTLDVACDGTVVEVVEPDSAPVADYLATRDVVCHVPGNQRVETHVIVLPPEYPAAEA